MIHQTSGRSYLKYTRMGNVSRRLGECLREGVLKIEGKVARIGTRRRAIRITRCSSCGRGVFRAYLYSPFSLNSCPRLLKGQANPPSPPMG